MTNTICTSFAGQNKIYSGGDMFSAFFNDHGKHQGFSSKKFGGVNSNFISCYYVTLIQLLLFFISYIRHNKTFQVLFKEPFLMKNLTSMSQVQLVESDDDKVFRRRHQPPRVRPTRPNRLKKNIPRQKKTFEEECIDYWNSFDYVQKHKHGTKTARRICDNLRGLRSGAFFNNKRLDEGFRIDAKIPKSWTKKHRWSKKQILEGLKLLSLLSDPDYFPKDKRNVRNLDLLLYNDYSFTSRFLAVMAVPPLKNYKVVLFEPRLIDKIVKYARLKNPSTNDIRTLSQGLESISKVRERFPLTHYVVRSQLGYNARLIDKYIEYLDKQDWISKPGVNLFRADNVVFENFLEDWEKRFNIDLDFKPYEGGGK